MRKRIMPALVIALLCSPTPGFAFAAPKPSDDLRGQLRQCRLAPPGPARRVCVLRALLKLGVRYLGEATEEVIKHALAIAGYEALSRELFPDENDTETVPEWKPAVPPCGEFDAGA